MILSPCSREAANAFVDLFHRHSDQVVSDLFRVALETETGGAIAVAIAGLPKARMFQDGRTFEITRVTAREGTPNACSRLYGALCDAARALGYWRAITYTLLEEPGTSPKAAGFERDGETEEDDWRERARRKKVAFLPGFEEERGSPEGPKVRFVRYLTPHARKHYEALRRARTPP